MLAVEKWISERLTKIDAEKFAKLPHRNVPENCSAAASVSYFSVPVAGGVSTALLATPKVTTVNITDSVLVLFFHGLGDDATYPLWHWIDIYTRCGFSVLSVDWDGHGAPGTSLLDFQVASRTIPLILQRLYGEPGEQEFAHFRPGPSCYLMGHSAGGALALLAVTRPDVARLVQGLVCVSPAIALANRSASLLELLSFFSPRAWWRDLFSKMPYYGVLGIIPAAGNFRRKSFPLRLRVGIPYASQLRIFSKETFEVRRILRDVKVPVLWLHGGKDHIVPLRRVERLMAEIPSQLFCHIDPSRGHLLMAFSSQMPFYASRFLELCAFSKAAAPAAPSV